MINEKIISCIPYVYCFKLPLTLGTLTIFFNLILILIQIGILRKNYRLLQLLQLPVVFAFGAFVDLTLNFVSGIIHCDKLYFTILIIQSKLCRTRFYSLHFNKRYKKTS